MKRDFHKNTELHAELIAARESGMLMDDIAKKFPQYSKVTYKKFFSKIGLKSSKDFYKSEAFKEKQRSSQKKAWDEKDQCAKEKHIEHLSLLSAEQRGQTLLHSDEWRRNNLTHLQSDKMKEVRTKTNNAKKKHTLDRIISKAEELGVDLVGDLSDSSNAILVYPRSGGAPRRLEIKKMMSMGEVLPKFISTGEAEIGRFISSLGLDWRPHKLGRNELDIYIPSKNIAIEFNGLFWHSEARKQASYHINKTLRAAESGIRLIHIFEHEWAHRKDQVCQRLRSILGVCNKKIGARLCRVVNVDPNIALDIINKFHIQPLKSSPPISIGLEYEGRIVAVAALGRHHRDSSKWVLRRYVSEGDMHILGGLSRLSRRATALVGDLETWADLRWSTGDGYRKAGWEEVARTGPDYFYFLSGTTEVISKQSRRKSAVNTPAGITEHEHALTDGLYRVYDCGKIRFIYRKQD